MEEKPEESRKPEKNERENNPDRMASVKRRLTGALSGFKETFAMPKKYKPEDINDQLVAQAIERATRLNPHAAFRYNSIYDELDQFTNPDPKVTEMIRIKTRKIVRSGALATSSETFDKNGNPVEFFEISDKELLHKIANGEQAFNEPAEED